MKEIIVRTSAFILIEIVKWYNTHVCELKTQGNSNPSLTPVPRIQYLLLTPSTQDICMVHRCKCRQNNHSHKINKFNRTIVDHSVVL